MPWSVDPFYSSHEWYALKKVVLNRDKRCVKCGSTQSLRVDHVINRANGGTDEPNNLQVLCGFHHDEKTLLEAAEGRKKRAALRLRSDTGYQGPRRKLKGGDHSPTR